MQKRHFQLIARVVRKQPAATRVKLATDFVEALMPTNPEFNSATFYKACGVEVEATFNPV